jgi:hypothetical protein
MGQVGTAAHVAWIVANMPLYREQHRNSRFIVEEYGIHSCFAKEDPRRHEFVTTDQAFLPHGVQL